MMPVSSTTPPPLEPASLFKRLAAFCYDALLLIGLVGSFTLLVVLVRGGDAITPGSRWFQFALLAIVIAFFCGFWTRGGQTLGMRAWRIRVVTEDGGALSWPRALSRFAAGVVSLLPLGLGLWWAVFDPQRRGWHDRLTRTRVVRAQSPGVTSPSRPQRS